MQIPPLHSALWEPRALGPTDPSLTRRWGTHFCSQISRPHARPEFGSDSFKVLLIDSDTAVAPSLRHTNTRLHTVTHTHTHTQTHRCNAQAATLHLIFSAMISIFITECFLHPTVHRFISDVTVFTMSACVGRSKKNNSFNSIASVCVSICSALLLKLQNTQISADTV